MPARLEYDFISEQINKCGYYLLSKNYVNANSKLKVKCPKDHVYYVRWGNFYTGNRCPICYGRKRNSIKSIKNYAKKFGYEVLSNEYYKSVGKIRIKCPSNHIYESAWGSFQSGSRCPICWFSKNRGSNHGCWMGGFKHPYCKDWTSDLKEYIKYRDGNKCLNPLCEKGSGLSVHHINYDKKSCERENLITLCKSCHAKSNFDRKWHESWYRAILFRRYNYIYGV